MLFYKISPKALNFVKYYLDSYLVKGFIKISLVSYLSLAVFFKNIS